MPPIFRDLKPSAKGLSIVCHNANNATDLISLVRNVQEIKVYLHRLFFNLFFSNPTIQRSKYLKCLSKERTFNKALFMSTVKCSSLEHLDLEDVPEAENLLHDIIWNFYDSSDTFVKKTLSFIDTKHEILETMHLPPYKIVLETPTRSKFSMMVVKRLRIFEGKTKLLLMSECKYGSSEDIKLLFCEKTSSRIGVCLPNWLQEDSSVLYLSSGAKSKSEQLRDEFPDPHFWNTFNMRF